MNKIPFGYKLAEDGSSIVECELEQAVIACVDRLRKLGMTHAEIGDILQEEGVGAKQKQNGERARN